jgi:beta-N-acetylhexosaminidase
MFDVPAPASTSQFTAGSCLALVAMPAQPQWTPYIDYAIRDLGVRTLLIKGGTCGEAAQAIRRWRDLSSDPLLMLVDAEYGTAMRFDDGTGEPKARALGQEPIEKTEEAHERIGRDLHAMGLDVSLGPVADVWINERSAFLQPRCFGSEPHLVAAHTAAAVRGLHRGAVGACLKHFPGHGGASGDSHKEFPQDLVQISTWREFHRVPFLEGLTAQPEMVMVAHLQMPGLEPSEEPTTFSKRVIGELLRKEMQFDGVVVTDALNMRAILARWEPPEACLRALQAGNDLCLLCEDDLGPDLYTHWLPKIVDRIELALKTGELNRQQWLLSCQRVQKLIQSRLAHRSSPSEHEATELAQGSAEQQNSVRNLMEADKIGERSGMAHQDRC